MFKRTKAEKKRLWRKLQTLKHRTSISKSRAGEYIPNIPVKCDFLKTQQISDSTWIHCNGRDLSYRNWAYPNGGLDFHFAIVDKLHDNRWNRENTRPDLL